MGDRSDCVTFESDLECILLAAQSLRSLGLFPKYCSLRINTLGDTQSREAYRIALLKYLEPIKQNLSELSVSRLERGSVLRILDSKDPQDQLLLQDAPCLSDYLSNESAARFKSILKGLEAVGIDYTWDTKLVRGLDYYSHTCWEFVEQHNEQLGLGVSHSAILAGGRYDMLACSFGSKAIPSVGYTFTFNFN